MTFIQYSFKQHLFSLTIGRVVLVDCEGIGAIFSSSTFDPTLDNYPRVVDRESRFYPQISLKNQKYDVLAGPFVASLRRTGMDVYPPKEGMRVLEVGCGTGTNLSLYQKAGCDIFGIDVSPAMLEVAGNKLGDRAELLLGSAVDMRYPDDFFDLVICTLTIHEMPRTVRPQVLNEVERVLKKNGHILVIDFHVGPIRFPMGWVYRAVIYFFEIGAGLEHFRNYRDFLANNGIPGLLRSRKLAIEKTEIVRGGNLGVYLLCAE